MERRHVLLGGSKLQYGSLIYVKLIVCHITFVSWLRAPVDSLMSVGLV